jgi:transcriptional regulator with GAF, ATPase, and Fis domain
VGDTRTRQLDVRVIAATNRDLKREVETGWFRQDLFYCLSVFPVDIPPLREPRALSDEVLYEPRNILTTLD